MQRVSARTLVLMLLLLGYVLAHQYLGGAAARADAVWLLEESNEPNEPPRPETV